MLSKTWKIQHHMAFFFINFGKKARVYYTLCISRGGGGGRPPPPPGFATVVTIWNTLPNNVVLSESLNAFKNRQDYEDIKLWRNH